MLPVASDNQTPTSTITYRSKLLKAVSPAGSGSSQSISAMAAETPARSDSRSQTLMTLSSMDSAHALDHLTNVSETHEFPRMMQKFVQNHALIQSEDMDSMSGSEYYANSHP